MNCSWRGWIVSALAACAGRARCPFVISLSLVVLVLPKPICLRTESVKNGFGAGFLAFYGQGGLANESHAAPRAATRDMVIYYII